MMQFDRPIAFLPGLARELGGIEEALFYQQLHYWSTRGHREDGWVYKTINEIEEETTLTRRKQDRIRAKLIEKGWIETKKTHAPNGSPTLHYRCLVEISICTKRTNGNVRNVQNHLHEPYKSSFTESTTESTTDISERSSEKNTKEENKQIQEVIYAFREENPNYQNLFMRKNQREATKRMIQRFGYEKLLKAIESLSYTNKEPYAPTITTPIQLEEKMGKLKAFYERKKKGRKGIVV